MVGMVGRVMGTDGIVGMVGTDGIVWGGGGVVVTGGVMLGGGCVGTSGTVGTVAPRPAVAPGAVGPVVEVVAPDCDGVASVLGAHAAPAKANPNTIAT